MKREEAMKLVQDGITALNEALRAGRSETLERFLATLGRFHHYSFRNAILIDAQKPEATQVAGFHAWRKLGRQVKKGEHGIAILAPLVGSLKDADTEDKSRDSIFGFKVAYVFDVSQTEGDPLPEFAAARGEPGPWMDRLEDAIRKEGIEVKVDFILGGAKGMSSNGRVTIRPDLSASEKFAVLAHEFAHELLHQRTDRVKETTAKLRETEAEAVAFVVCRAFDIDSTIRSSDYIQLYRGDEETLRESLSFVQNTAGQIIEGIRGKRPNMQTAKTPSLAA